MDGRSLSRRVLIMTSLAAAFPFVGGAKAQDSSIDPKFVRFRAIAVDASPVAERGARSTAAVIERQLSLEAREVFADLLTPSDARAPRLLLRVDSIQLAAYTGENPILSGASSAVDYLEGAGLVMVGGRARSTTPMLSALNASYSGGWALPDIDERRVASICHHFAYWIRREMGL